MRKIAIVGTSPQNAHLAPYNDPTWEIWGISRMYLQVPRWDRWYELHRFEELCRTWAPGQDDVEAEARKSYVAWLTQDHGKPIYVQPPLAGQGPSLVAFPLEQIVAAFPARYFTNQISYMIAHAIMELGNEGSLGVWGVDMAMKCLAPEARVLTADLEWVPAGDIEVGAQLLAFDEDALPGNATRRWRTSTVLGRSEAKLPSYRIHLEDGTSVVASADHRWLTYAEHEMRWKRTDELVSPAHRPGRPTRIHRPVEVWSEDTSYEAGYLAAAFDGEGWLGQRENGNSDTYGLQLGYSQRENEMSAAVEAALLMKGFRWSKNPSKAVVPVGGGGSAPRPTWSYAINGGRPEIMRFLGRFRPRRLLGSFRPDRLGQFTRKAAVAVEAIEFLGDVDTVGFTTSTRTLIVEGLASHNSEYREQRPSCEYFLGIAEGRGIDVVIPEQSNLLKASGLYGFDLPNPMLETLKAKKKELAQRRAEVEHGLKQGQMQFAGLSGAVDIIDGLLQNWE